MTGLYFYPAGVGARANQVKRGQIYLTTHKTKREAAIRDKLKGLQKQKRRREADAIIWDIYLKSLQESRGNHNGFETLRDFSVTILQSSQ